jgi:hypothetical protein
MVVQFVVGGVVRPIICFVEVMDDDGGGSDAMGALYTIEPLSVDVVDGDTTE